MKQIITAGLALLGWVMLPGTVLLAQKPLGDVKAGGDDVWRCPSTCRVFLQSDGGLIILTPLCSLQCKSFLKAGLFCVP